MISGLTKKRTVGWLLTCMLTAAAYGGSVDFVTDKTQRDYAARFRSSYHLGHQFDQENIESMILFLHRLPKDDVVAPDELASLKNNIADLLIEQKDLAPRLLNEFFAMYAEQSLGNTWRNYVVQKVPSICVVLKDRETYSRGLDFMRRVARDPSTGFVCEVFLGLDRICEVRPDQISPEELRREAAACLLAEETPPETKGIVVQILAKYDALTARELALSYLSRESSIMLKASSLAVLGKTGRPEDVAIINEYTLSPDVRLGEASRAALKRLQKAATNASK